eukprot:gb/GECG01011018.1/.p1 GENE.gb/GECG01011018.1/~~gb/GECG01011018.1/.p1  ORF type:complete len:399 (+),score=50.61 gb/GECG01011018.1/:1-1197(+)
MSASDSNNQGEDSLRESLECPLCLKVFLDCVSLPCGHSFCRVCLKRSFEVSSACPICRNVYFVEPNELPVTYAISQLVQTHFQEELEERRKEVQEEEKENNTKTVPLFFDKETDGFYFPGQPFGLRMFEPRYKTLVQRVALHTRVFGIQKSPESTQGVIASLEHVEEGVGGDYVIAGKITHRYNVEEGSLREEADTQGLHVARVLTFEDDHVPQEADTQNSMPPLQLAKKLSDTIRSTFEDLRNKIGPHNAFRITRQLGNPPVQPTSMSLFGMAAFSLPSETRNYCFQSTDPLLRLKILYCFLAKLQEDKQKAGRIVNNVEDFSNLVEEAKTLPESRIEDLGPVSLRALAFYEHGGWSALLDKTLYQPTVSDSLIIILIAALLLYLFKNGYFGPPADF